MQALYPTLNPATTLATREPERAREPRLLDRVRDRIRYKHYSIRTEQAYLDWIRRFIWFHDRRFHDADDRADPGPVAFASVNRAHNFVGGDDRN